MCVCFSRKPKNESEKEIQTKNAITDGRSFFDGSPKDEMDNLSLAVQLATSESDPISDFCGI